MQAEAPEAADLNPFTARQLLRYVLEQGFDGNFDVSIGQLRLVLRDAFDHSSDFVILQSPASHY